MKSYLHLLTFAVLLTSCSSVYKSGQTPDDVYYSPERQRDEYVRVEERNDRRLDRDDEFSREERYLRMKARNRRYGLLDDDYDYYAYNGSNYYRYNDYYRMNRFGYYNNNYNNWLIWNSRFGNPYYNPFYYNPYYYNPYHNNPYYAGTVYGNTSPVYNKPRTTNLHVFDRNSNNPNVPRNNGRTFSPSQGEDNYRGSGTNAGGFLRNVFGTTNGSSSNNSSTEATKSGSSNSGSSSSSSGNSGSSRAPVRRF